ncbi:VanZ family protein [Pelagicoccus sp. SDUM812003]|uniref:VanZ family protein n=1 Tax=Pelagicoccus sp. SDUM812003 TaxID=3041267 RepID=UPI00280E2E2B|nr:VanZ family protein [Pelagicoccus sp. SDUM812003]MDQ8203889.1 VanZ family protein [Pelagicoccus sp. SDUM812003]
MSEPRGPDTNTSQGRLAWPPIALTATLVAASFLSPVAPAAPNVVGFDKIAHFCVFGLLGTLLFRRLRQPFLSNRRVLWALIGAVSYGALDESLQFFNPARSFDPLDWIADLSGALLAIYLYRNWAWYRRLLEFPIWGSRTASSAKNPSTQNEQG